MVKGQERTCLASRVEPGGTLSESVVRSSVGRRYVADGSQAVPSITETTFPPTRTAVISCAP